MLLRSTMSRTNRFFRLTLNSPIAEYAVQENIEISAEYIEKQSAKVPGRRYSTNDIRVKLSAETSSHGIPIV